MKRPFTYLALGDSYTIGEMVPATENFPNQVAVILRKQGIAVEEPRIIAKTGWTTDELEAGIQSTDQEDLLAEYYDMVTLLIGVNNQYRGRSIDNYRQEFTELVKKALKFAGNDPKRTIILSIPDWGITPFAKDRDRNKIGKEIDEYNAINKAIANLHQIHYIYITEWTREAATDASLLAADGLHPSGKEYLRWAETIAATFRAEITL